MNRIKFLADISDWIFPIAIHLTCVGNNNRPYTLSLDCLCFRLIICIDEDSY